ncbi:hypothetical protein pipiens_016790 [Culex pipiens pipiens]|uniref:Uncharacterized protein n=1 Tax=Culex pipiens pipiens TaxID=38569 RepID=A0ABD1CJP8_CULPP
MSRWAGCAIESVSRLAEEKTGYLPSVRDRIGVPLGRLRDRIGVPLGRGKANGSCVRKIRLRDRIGVPLGRLRDRIGVPLGRGEDWILAKRARSNRCPAGPGKPTEAACAKSGCAINCVPLGRLRDRIGVRFREELPSARSNRCPAGPGKANGSCVRKIRLRDRIGVPLGRLRDRIGAGCAIESVSRLAEEKTGYLPSVRDRIGVPLGRLRDRIGVPLGRGKANGSCVRKIRLRDRIGVPLGRLRDRIGVPLGRGEDWKLAKRARSNRCPAGPGKANGSCVRKIRLRDRIGVPLGRLRDRIGVPLGRGEDRILAKRARSNRCPAGPGKANGSCVRKIRLRDRIGVPLGRLRDRIGVPRRGED